MSLKLNLETLRENIWGPIYAVPNVPQDKQKEISLRIESALVWANGISSCQQLEGLRRKGWNNYSRRWDLAPAVPECLDYDFWMPEIIAAYLGDHTSHSRFVSRIFRLYEDNFFFVADWVAVSDCPIITFDSKDIRDSKIQGRLFSNAYRPG
jgi:hypothetical protein